MNAEEDGYIRSWWTSKQLSLRRSERRKKDKREERK